MADEPRDPLSDGAENDPSEEFRDMLRDFLAGNSELDPAQAHRPGPQLVTRPPLRHRSSQM